MYIAYLVNYIATFRLTFMAARGNPISHASPNRLTGCIDSTADDGPRFPPIARHGPRNRAVHSRGSEAIPALRLGCKATRRALAFGPVGEQPPVPNRPFCQGPCDGAAYRGLAGSTLTVYPLMVAPCMARTTWPATSLGTSTKVKRS